MLDVNEIMKLLPHRHPFLMVDRVLELEPGKRAVGIKNVTINEAFFVGHFPNFPVMPGVLTIEAMAQLGGIILLKLPECQGKLTFFAAIDEVRFRKPVVPGDQLRIEAEVLKIKGMTSKVRAKALVDGKVVTEGTFMFTLAERPTEGAKIHPTATVNPSAILAKNVEVGPYASVGEEVKIDEGTIIYPHATIRKWTTIGKNCRIHSGAVIGDDPQDLGYKGEKSYVEIGDNNLIREGVTIHRATGEGKKTVVGNKNFIMNDVHLAHNCQLGDEISIAGSAQLAGYVKVENQVVIGGLTGIHQFVRVGRLAMVGGFSRIAQDIPPFMLAEGNPAQIRAVNSVGMQRRGISSQAQGEIKKVYRILYRYGLNISQATEEIRKKVEPLPEVKAILTFLEESGRGVSKRVEEDIEL